MSSLPSASKPSPVIPDLAQRPQQLVFLTPLATQLSEFMREIDALVRFEPVILQQIEDDLDLVAKKKKLLRLADARFRDGQTCDLPALEIKLRAPRLDQISLESGRPRTEAYVVYLFLMLRGWSGGCKDQDARQLLEESITVRLWLEALGLELPPASTLSDNLNGVSNATREFILRAQLRFIAARALDDFKKLFIDSTAVAANSARPTDSTLLIKLLERITNFGAHLHRLDLPDMNQTGLAQQLGELRALSQQILFLHGPGARVQGRRRRLYFQLLRRVRRLRQRLLRDFETVRVHLEARVDFLPSRRLAVEEVLRQIAADLAALEQAAAVCERRTMGGEKVPVQEKLLSVSDADAAFIVKGGWNSILGYRPQLARSGAGFVTALKVPTGNAADSPQLAAMVRQHQAHTGVLAPQVSVDDGYSSQEGVEAVRALGVTLLSVGGAKGKKLLEPGLWKSAAYRRARAERSAIESLFFTLKDGFEFGMVRRRGLEPARAELLEKILAYNITQLLRVEQRKNEAPERRRAA